MADVNYKIQRHKDGSATVTLIIPAGLSPVEIKTDGRNINEAVARAASAATAIVESPVLSAVLPPGSALAIKAIKHLATSKNVRQAMSKITGPGAKRLAAVFGF